MIPESRNRQVPYTVAVPKSRNRMVNGKVQLATEMVAEQRTRTETYVVTVPQSREFTVEVPEGSNWKEVVRTKLHLPSARSRRDSTRPIPSVGDMYDEEVPESTSQIPELIGDK